MAFVGTGLGRVYAVRGNRGEGIGDGRWEGGHAVTADV